MNRYGKIVIVIWLLFLSSEGFNQDMLSALPEIDIFLNIMSNNDTLKNEIETYFQNSLKSVDGIRITKNENYDLKIEVIVVSPDPFYSNYYAISTLFSIPFDSDYLEGLIDICRDINSTSRLSKNQKELIKRETDGVQLWEIINHSIHTTNGVYLKSCCVEIVEKFCNQFLEKLRRRKAMIEYVKSRPKYSILKRKNL